MILTNSQLQATDDSPRGGRRLEELHLYYKNKADSLLLLHRTEHDRFSMKSCHFHKRYEIYYLFSGERYYFIKDRSYRVQAGDLVFIPPNAIHKTADTERAVPHERVVIEADTSIFSTMDEAICTAFQPHILGDGIIKLSLKEQLFVENILRSMLNEAATQHLGFENYLHALLQQLLIFVARFIQYSGRNTGQGHLPKTHQKVNEIVEYINKNYASNLTLSNVANAYNLNPVYLSRIFKEITGFTFLEYLNNVRISEAKRLLRESEMKVIAIANEVGMDNQSHFGRVFKAVTGTTPLQYRKEIGRLAER